MIQKAHVKSLLKLTIWMNINSAKNQFILAKSLPWDLKTHAFRQESKMPQFVFLAGKEFHIAELLSNGRIFRVKGKYSRNMKDAHLERAARKGSLGVGRFYFRVRTDELRIFDIYYDRTIKNSIETSGFWVLFQELAFRINS